MTAILAQKLEMTHVFDGKGNFVPVTLLLASGNVVTQVKSVDKDGYDSIQVGFGEAKNLKKPQEGHLKKSGKKLRKLAEVQAEDGKIYVVGDEIAVDEFNEGDLVDVQGVSKGKGFAGTIKRYHFNTGPKTHGSHNYRAPGSIGAGYPQHVLRGQKLPGRMGGGKVTTKNLKIAEVIPEEGLLLVRGAIPGPKKGIVLVTLRKSAPKKEVEANNSVETEETGEKKE
jgi:large subunit ribosomal protein L3